MAEILCSYMNLQEERLFQQMATCPAAPDIRPGSGDSPMEEMIHVRLYPIHDFDVVLSAHLRFG
jgi:hypothetical protein